MEVKVTKITDEELLRKVCSYTIGKPSKVTLDQMYRCQHSPIRSQIFIVELIDVYSFVSMHFARHHVHIDHFIKSNRIDRHGDHDANRYSLVNHLFICNGESLINMARKRLCAQASPETREVMQEIVKQVAKVDEALVHYLVPECDYRGGICYEIYKPCGRY